MALNCRSPACCTPSNKSVPMRRCSNGIGSGVVNCRNCRPPSGLRHRKTTFSTLFRPKNTMPARSGSPDKNAIRWLRRNSHKGHLTCAVCKRQNPVQNADLRIFTVRKIKMIRNPKLGLRAIQGSFSSSKAEQNSASKASKAKQAKQS